MNQEEFKKYILTVWQNFSCYEKKRRREDFIRNSLNKELFLASGWQQIINKIPPDAVLDFLLNHWLIAKNIILDNCILDFPGGNEDPIFGYEDEIGWDERGYPMQLDEFGDPVNNQP